MFEEVGLRFDCLEVWGIIASLWLPMDPPLSPAKANRLLAWFLWVMGVASWKKEAGSEYLWAAS
jgi:hypothetical protein